MTASSKPRRREAPDRNLALELVRVTEAGALAAGRWVGRGNKAPQWTQCGSLSALCP